MYSVFENLPDDKKQKIIDAAIEEFALNGYRNGSTNEIVKKAGISKGILFHYFENKKNLYLYILDYSIDYYSEFFNDYIRDIDKDDIFEIIKDINLKKLELFSDSPIMYEFITKAFVSYPEELEEDIKKRYLEVFNESFGKIISKLNMNKFREGIDKSKALEVIMFTLDGLTNKYIKEYKRKEDKIIGDVNELMNIFDEYLEILKWGITYDPGATRHM